jgi:hypothetical protein
MVQKLCTHAKMIPVETTQGIGRESWGGEFMYDIFDTTCVNATMYPHPAQQ